MENTRKSIRIVVKGLKSKRSRNNSKVVLDFSVKQKCPLRKTPKHNVIAHTGRFSFKCQ